MAEYDPDFNNAVTRYYANLAYWQGKVARWNRAKYVKRLVWFGKFSDGKVRIFTKGYKRYAYDGEMLEIVTSEEYLVRELAGTLKQPPQHVLDCKPVNPTKGTSISM